MGRPPAAIPRVAQELAEGIVDGVHPEQLILFGSHARGAATPGSDVDLLVVLRTEESPAEACIRVRRAARARRRGVPLDVLVYTPDDLEARLAAGDPLLHLILREGVVLYAK